MKSIILTVLAVAPIFAQEAAEGAQQQGGGIMSFLPFILLFVVMWLFFIRPKQKEMKKQEEMRKSIKVGDKVTTFAGIIGTIYRIEDTTITLRTGSSTIEFQKAAIASVVAATVSEAPKAEEKKIEEAK